MTQSNIEDFNNEYEGEGQEAESWKNKSTEDLTSSELIECLVAHNTNKSCVNLLVDLDVNGRMFSMDEFLDFAFKTEENEKARQKFGVGSLHVASFEKIRKEILEGNRTGHRVKVRRHHASNNNNNSASSERINFTRSCDVNGAPEEGKRVLFGSNIGFGYERLHVTGGSSKEECVGSVVEMKVRYSTGAQRWLVRYRDGENGKGEFISLSPDFNQDLALDATGAGKHSNLKVTPHDPSNDGQSFYLVDLGIVENRRVQLVPKTDTSRAVGLGSHDTNEKDDKRVILVSRAPTISFSLHYYDRAKDTFPELSVEPLRPSDQVPDFSLSRGCDCSVRCFEAHLCCCVFQGIICANSTADAMMNATNWASEREEGCRCSPLGTILTGISSLVIPLYVTIAHEFPAQMVTSRLRYHNSFSISRKLYNCSPTALFCHPAFLSAMARELEENKIWNGSMCSSRTARDPKDESIGKEEEFPNPKYWELKCAALNLKHPNPKEMG